MYESFYNLKEKPFNLTPDPHYLYMSDAHENALAHLEYAVKENKGFVVITGEIGSGKTTLINYLIRNIPENVLVGIINQTRISHVQFIKMVCQEFDIAVDGMDKAESLNSLNSFLLESYSRNQRVVLIIDEAQNLPFKTMEEIRMLSNLEDEKHHLLQIVLLGQPELKSRLQHNGLQQFAQRVSVYYHLECLKENDVGRYINYRLQKAGAVDSGIFDEGAIKGIFNHTAGVPRKINVLCDAALVYGFADDLKRIGPGVIRQVVEDNKAIGIASSDPQKEHTESLNEQDLDNSLLLAHLSGLGEQLAELSDLFHQHIRNQEKILEKQREHTIQTVKEMIAGELKNYGEDTSANRRLGDELPLQEGFSYCKGKDLDDEDASKATDAKRTKIGGIGAGKEWALRLAGPVRKWFAP